MPDATSRAERKRAELKAKLSGICDEFSTWRQASAPDGPLEKHHTQIRAVTAALAVPLADLIEKVDGPGGDGRVLAGWTRVERELLGLHEVWGFFREKLALRYVTAFQRYLTLADEFAWACYVPARERGSGPHNVPADSVREPPLVFLDRVSSPFTLPRGTSFAEEVDTAALTVEELREAVQGLPIPVVGVPWFQLRHLPDALVIAHEVGHQVEHDFRLTETLEALLSAALDRAGTTPARRTAWEGWLEEVFADVYGVLAAGPAYPLVLADFVATGPVAAAGSAGYPPAGLRVRIAADALRGSGFPDEADQVLDRWSRDFPGEDRPSFDAEAAAVAAALLAGPYPQFGGVRLTEVLDFTDRHALADGSAAALLASYDLSIDMDVRCLLAAAGLAFARKPELYLAEDVTSRVLDHAKQIRTRGIRAAVPERELPARDQAAGQGLLALLTRAAR